MSYDERQGELMLRVEHAKSLKINYLASADSEIARIESSLAAAKRHRKEIEESRPRDILEMERYELNRKQELADEMKYRKIDERNELADIARANACRVSDAAIKYQCILMLACAVLGGLFLSGNKAELLLAGMTISLGPILLSRYS